MLSGMDSTAFQLDISLRKFLISMQKRAPALLDNLSQAFLMAPFFVLLEVVVTYSAKSYVWLITAIKAFMVFLLQVLQQLWGYEPYPGFHASVHKKIEANIKQWQAKHAKKEK